jgi:hypothetical protein
LLATRLGPDAFIGSAALIEASRVLAAVGGMAPAPGRRHRLVASVSGFYPDRWSYPLASFVLAAAAELREVTLEAIAAQHLPAGTSLELAVNAVPAGSVWMNPGQSFAVTVLLGRHLDGLAKILTARCSVTIDPRSVGFNEDRRPLSFLLLRLTLLEADGTLTVVEGEALVGDAVAAAAVPE